MVGISEGLVTLLFASPAERADLATGSVFGGVAYERLLPISFWDILQTGWPMCSPEMLINRDSSFESDQALIFSLMTPFISFQCSVFGLSSV